MSERGIGIYLETPKKFRSLANQAYQVAGNYLRPISHKYDKTGHAYPKELGLLAALLGGMNSGSPEAVGTTSASKRADKQVEEGIRSGGSPSASLGVMELCWGNIGLLLAMPRQGLGNTAIAAVANGKQLQHFGGTWAAMAITEPGYGSNSTVIRTTTTQGGDHYVLNGEKVFVTSGERADAMVVWATLNRNLGQATIKSFAIEGGTPGMTVTRLEKKLGIKTSDTASISFNDCRVSAANLLGNAEVDVQRGFAGVMETFDNTRPLMAGMAVGVARATLDQARELLKKAGCKFDYRKPLLTVSHAGATFYRPEAEWEAARLLTSKTTQMANNKLPNSKETSITKAKAGRVANEITLRCVKPAGTLGYTEDEPLEKWTRDSRVLDIFEGTRQIRLFVVARRLLGKSSSQLK